MEHTWDVFLCKGLERLRISFEVAGLFDEGTWMGTSMRPNCETDVISMLVTRPEDMYLTRRFSTGHLFHERRTAGGRSLHLSDSYLPQASLPKFPSSAFQIGIGSCLQSVSIYQRQPSYLPEDVR